MELLRSWCNDELRLSRPVRSFEADFRNGYLLGEILSKYGLLEDLHLFSRGDGPHAMIKNFNLLQPALRRINVNVDSRTANHIMVEKPGVASNVVYQLKIALNNARKSLGTNLPPRRDRTDLSETTLSTSRHLRAPHEEMRQRTFDQQLRMQTTDPRELRMSQHLSKFTEAMYEMTRKSLDDSREEEEAAADVQRTRMTAQRERLRESRAFMDQWTADSASRHRATMRAKREAERAELRWELTTRERRARKERMATASHAEDLANGLHEFERTLHRLGADAGPGAEDEPGGDGDAADESQVVADSAAARASAHDHFLRLQDMLPDAASMESDVGGYVERLRARKVEEAVARKEREVRRRRVLLEQQQAQEELEARRREEELVSKLSRQSAEERRIAERLWRTRQEAEVMRANRLLREEQYEARRAADMADRVERNKARAAARLSEYKAQLATERRRFEDAEAARTAVRRQLREQECRRVIDELVAVTFRAATYRSDAHGQLPARVWRELCTLFVAGVPLEALGGPGTTRAALEEAEAAEASGATDVPLRPEARDDHRPGSLLDEVAFAHFLAGSGDFSPDALVSGLERSATDVAGAAELTVDALSATEAEEAAALEGQALYAILDVAQPPPPAPPPPAVPESKLRVALAGRPFAGKSTLAVDIAGALDLELILPVELVHAAMAEYKAAEAAREAAGGGAGAGDDEAYVSLGKQAADASAAGRAVPDSVVAALVLQAVSAIDDARAGFLLDGFPSTPAQLAALEKGLTGYEPVVDVKKKPPQTRLVAPPPGADAAPPPRKPGLDVVLRLDISDDLARRRALGRRLDPQTGVVYHLEFEPPAEDDDLQQRLVPLRTESNAEAHLLPLLQSYKDSEQSLEQWTTALGILKSIDATATPDEVFGAAREVIAEIAAAKAEALEAKEAEEVTAAAEADAEAGAAADVAPHEPEDGTDPTAASAAAAAATAVGAPARAMPVHIPAPLEAEVAQHLLARWRDMESAYTSAVRARLGELRDVEWAILQHTTQQARGFRAQLCHEDERQALVIAAQDTFNSIAPELRAEEEGKAELHAQADDLQDALWAAVDKKRAACEYEIHALALDGYAQHATLRAVNALLAVVQAEADRARNTATLVSDYYAARASNWVKAAELAGPAEVEPATAVGVVLSLPSFDGLDPEAAQTAARPAAKGSKKPPGGKPGAGAPSAGNPATRELPTPMSGDPAEDQLFARAMPALALADAVDAAATAGDVAAAAAEAAESAADPPPSEEVAQRGRAARQLDAEARAVWRAEAAKLRRRVRTVQAYGTRILNDLREHFQRLYAQLDAWLGGRVTAELEAIGALIKLIRAAVEAETPLAHALSLQGEDMKVDEAVLMTEAVQSPPPPPPVQKPDALRLTVAQLAALGARFHEESVSSMVPLRTAIDTLLRAAAAGELPREWRRFERSVLQEACRLFSYGQSQQVSWAALLLALSGAPAPKHEQVAEAAEELERYAVSGEEGGITRSAWEELRLWFESARGDVVEGEAPTVDAAIGDDFNLEAALKSALFDALAARHGGAAPKLNHRRFLLYACDSVPKAFAAVGYRSGGAVSAVELFEMFHREDIPLPSDPRATLPPHADPFSMDVIHRLFAELNCDPATDKVSYLMVAKHPLGSKLINACELYRINDVYGALEAKLEAAGTALEI